MKSFIAKTLLLTSSFQSFGVKSEIVTSRLADALSQSQLVEQENLLDMLNDSMCDKECLSLSLSYFPSKMAVQKCGCLTAFEKSLAFKSGTRIEKFFDHPIIDSEASTIEAQSRAEYEDRLRAIDLQILNEGMSPRDASIIMAETNKN